jgi:dienelactone hydrolase
MNCKPGSSRVVRLLCHAALQALRLAAVAALVLRTADAAAAGLPDQVTFMSADGRTTLVGYVFRPEGPHALRTPAVVMLHGRDGPYSSTANGRYDASTLSKHHLYWGQIWAQQGYLAILVDGFGPRGYPQGFPRFSYETRPEELNEVTVRPLDAYGALAFLRSRDDVIADRVALQGWSNGGSATLATMANNAPGITAPTPATGFRAGLAFYPACGLKGKFADGIKPYAPVRMLHGSADEEVSTRGCAELVAKSRAAGGDIQQQIYPGASHDFDDPDRSHWDNPTNAAAARDAIPRAIAFFGGVLQPEGKVKAP